MPEDHDELAFCPNCGKAEGFKEYWAETREPYGEWHTDVWCACNACGAITDEQELERCKRRVPA